MNSTTFTRIVARHYLNDPDMPATVAMWLDEEGNPEKRKMAFAHCLCRDWKERWRRRNDGDAEGELLASIMRLAGQHIVWTAVAKMLLRAFTYPSMMARLASRPNCPPRLIAAIQRADFTLN